MAAIGEEARRLEESNRKEKDWQLWGTYLPERQWGTVREDYSADGSAWSSFPYSMAQFRAYRWGEDGILGWCDRECRLAYSTSLWNGHDPHLKERFFGLTGEEGNHGEDVKELYYYLDATPTASYARALYKYPQAAFPYQDLLDTNKARGFADAEYELIDTGVFADERYFDVEVEYAKRDVEDMLIRLTVTNRGPSVAACTVLPTLTLRNNWSWRDPDKDAEPSKEQTARPALFLDPERAETVIVTHPTLGKFRFCSLTSTGVSPAVMLFTENETNSSRMPGGNTEAASQMAFTKDAFDRAVIHREAVVNPEQRGTKLAFLCPLVLKAGESQVVLLRLTRVDKGHEDDLSQSAANDIFALRQKEADEFYQSRMPPDATADARNVMRQAYAGLLWSKQFYYYPVETWLAGDPAQPPIPDKRRTGRNHAWKHLYAKDVISMPDKWEYPWFAAWVLAFHVVPFAAIDPEFAKAQLLLLTREWYLSPDGQLPAYEFNFSDVNPPVQAWSVLRVYREVGARTGEWDTLFLERAFQKLLLNFTWWVGQTKDDQDNLFGGGFLGLDNIGVYNRSQPLPDGMQLIQADGTAWMGFFCGCMLQMAVELAQSRPAYEDIANKFFAHFVSIIDAMNTFNGTGLWDEEEGLFFDQLRSEDGETTFARIRSMVGLIPLFTVGILDHRQTDGLHDFTARVHWFLKHKPHLRQYVGQITAEANQNLAGSHFICLVPRDRMLRVLKRVLDETEFLSRYGLRSLSKHHKEHPFSIQIGEQSLSVKYEPAEGETVAFGGNSNWRGPIWLPLNALLINALYRYHAIYGDQLKIEYPAGSGTELNLSRIATDLKRRITKLFCFSAEGSRPVHGGQPRYDRGSVWEELVLFHEYFSGDDGRGCGAAHQTGWTALATLCFDEKSDL